MLKCDAKLVIWEGPLGSKSGDWWLVLALRTSACHMDLSASSLEWPNPIHK